VIEASDGKKGVDLTRELHPDLVLMDVMMPTMNGLEACEHIKSDPDTTEIPVVMLSAKSQTYEQSAGIDCGASAYICKPFTPKDLVERVAELLET